MIQMTTRTAVQGMNNKSDRVVGATAPRTNSLANVFESIYGSIPFAPLRSCGQQCVVFESLLRAIDPAACILLYCYTEGGQGRGRDGSPEYHQCNLSTPSWTADGLRGKTPYSHRQQQRATLET